MSFEIKTTCSSLITDKGIIKDPTPELWDEPLFLFGQIILKDNQKEIIFGNRIILGWLDLLDATIAITEGKLFSFYVDEHRDHKLIFTASNNNLKIISETGKEYSWNFSEPIELNLSLREFIQKVHKSGRNFLLQLKKSQIPKETTSKVENQLSLLLQFIGE